MSEYSLAQNLLPYIDSALMTFNTPDGSRILNEAQNEIRRRTVQTGTDKAGNPTTVSLEAFTASQVLNDLKANFLRITGVDLLQPFQVWKVEYLVKAIAPDMWTAIVNFQAGRKEFAKYIVVYRALLIENRQKLADYLAANKQQPTTPPGDPFEPVPGGPLNPGGPPPPPPPAPPIKPFYQNPVFLAIGGFTLLKIFKIV